MGNKHLKGVGSGMKMLMEKKSQFLMLISTLRGPDLDPAGSGSPTLQKKTLIRPFYELHVYTIKS
jgi:hypothetical protein